MLGSSRQLVLATALDQLPKHAKSEEWITSEIMNFSLMILCYDEPDVDWISTYEAAISQASTPTITKLKHFESSQVSCCCY